MLASGETRYVLENGGVHQLEMLVCGTRERILDSVLPHEITHTILATHFASLGKPVPRWADEGACTTVEHASERAKHDRMLVQFLGQGRGIPFASLFSMRDYPPDMMPLYAQGYSLCAFLIAQGGPRRFVQFLERGMEQEDWVGALDEFYEYPRLGKLQTAWKNWVSDGGGSVAQYTAEAQGFSTRNVAVNATADGVRLASAELPAPNLAIDRSIDQGADSVASANLSNQNVAASSTSASGSYYLDQFRKQQAQPSNAPMASASSNALPAPIASLPQPNGSIPYRASQPAPFQSMGGTILR
jgi:hypothetical protein